MHHVLSHSEQAQQCPHESKINSCWLNNSSVPISLWTEFSDLLNKCFFADLCVCVCVFSKRNPKICGELHGWKLEGEGRGGKPLNWYA